MHVTNKKVGRISPKSMTCITTDLFEAIAAYSTTLRITFATTIVFALLHLFLVIPVKLPEKDIVHEEELEE